MLDRLLWLLLLVSPMCGDSNLALGLLGLFVALEVTFWRWKRARDRREEAEFEKHLEKLLHFEE